MQHGAKIVVIEAGKPYPLIVEAAARGADATILQAMLDRGADVNAQDADGMTALMQTGVRGKSSNARLLLAHHANVAKKDRNGHTALWYATNNESGSPDSREQTIQLLRQAGAH